jgi:site-specific DNA recombinase
VRIATYTRISTDEVNQPHSLGAQSEAGRFDLLLVYRVDRLSRSVRGLAEVLETLDAAGVGFRSATEPFDTTSAAGRMMVQMLGVSAEFERATIIDRVIAGMERKASQGGWCGGRHPFGYRAAKGEGTLDVDEAEPPLIPVIFDLYASKRLGTHAIANWLRDAGLSTRAGKPWTSSGNARRDLPGDRTATRDVDHSVWMALPCPPQESSSGCLRPTRRTGHRHR